MKLCSGMSRVLLSNIVSNPLISDGTGVAEGQRLSNILCLSSAMTFTNGCICLTVVMPVSKASGIDQTESSWRRPSLWGVVSLIA